MALAAVGHHRVLGKLTAGDLFMASDRVGKQWRRLQSTLRHSPTEPSLSSPFNIVEP
jgi:hypothetical protein